jgi:hypothetical protein
MITLLDSVYKYPCLITFTRYKHLFLFSVNDFQIFFLVICFSIFTLGFLLYVSSAIQYTKLRSIPDDGNMFGGKFSLLYSFAVLMLQKNKIYRKDYLKMCTKTNSYYEDDEKTMIYHSDYEDVDETNLNPYQKNPFQRKCF